MGSQARIIRTPGFRSADTSHHHHPLCDLHMGLQSFFGGIIILCADDFQITSTAQTFLLRLRRVYLVPCWLRSPTRPINTSNLADLAILPPEASPTFLVPNRTWCITVSPQMFTEGPCAEHETMVKMGTPTFWMRSSQTLACMSHLRNSLKQS